MSIPNTLADCRNPAERITWYARVIHLAEREAQRRGALGTPPNTAARVNMWRFCALEERKRACHA